MRPLIPTQDPVQQFKSSWKVANYNMRRQLILWNECFPYPWIAPRRFNSMVDTEIVSLDVQVWRCDPSWSDDWAGTCPIFSSTMGPKSIDCPIHLPWLRLFWSDCEVPYRNIRGLQDLRVFLEDTKGGKSLHWTAGRAKRVGSSKQAILV